MPKTLEFKEFNIRDMVDHPTIVMIAKRGSGKSYLVRDVLYNINQSKRIPVGTIVSETELESPFYKNFFPDLYIHYEIKPGFLMELIKRQKIMIAKSKIKKSQQKKVDPTAVLIMDDMLADKKSWAKDVAIRKIMMNGRHLKLVFILTMQAPLGIDPQLRDNFDYVFLYPPENINNLKKQWENYAGCIPDIRLFNRILTKLTEDYKVMLVNRRPKGIELQDKVFWYKAKERDYMFGSKQFRKSHLHYYNSKFAQDELFDKPDMNVDLDSFIGKKKDIADIHVSLRKNTIKSRR